MGLLDGLEKFGLGSLKVKNLFEEEEKKEDPRKKVEVVKPTLEEMKEEDFLLNKKIHCPVCDFDFQTKAVKASKARRIGADRDLRPRFVGVDTIKYDVCACPKCGYSAMNRFFPHLSSLQIKLLKENVMLKFKGSEKAEAPAFYTYEEAIEKYKLSLLCTVVKKGKTSEKAYACLKLSWLCRGKLEELDGQGADKNSDIYKKYVAEEKEYYEQAYEGLTKAISSENYPICGMDQHTLDLLLAEMAFMLEKYEDASKMVSRLLTSQTCKGSIKDKAHDLKEEIVAKLAKR